MNKSYFSPNIIIPLIILSITLTSCSKDNKSTVAPLFANSIVSTDIDFIQSNDPDAAISLMYIGQEDKEMPDSRTDKLFDTNTYVFEVGFSNGTVVEIWAHSSFIGQSAAQEYAEKLTSSLGKLPEFMRNRLSHAVVHNGDASAFSEAEGHFIVLYSGNMDTHIGNNDLEETVFHETAHASLDEIFVSSFNWTNAQIADGNYITDYAKEYPMREDLAESAIFAYTMIKYPGRLSSEVEEWVKTYIPNRFAFFEKIFE